MPSPPAIFLSHNSEDKPVVREIAAALKRRRLQPWLDEEDLAEMAGPTPPPAAE